MAAAFDPNQHVLLVYGGRTPSDTWLDDTWTWDGTTWSHLQPTQHPVLRFAMGTFDSTLSKVVVYGLTPDYKSSQTWTWDGGWQQVTVGPEPPLRISSALAYDPASRTAILFGGRGLDLAYLQDTWRFDGASWQAVAGGVSPPPRQEPVMAAVSQGVLLFGGEANLTRVSDTWSWNGTTWRQLSTLHAPANWGVAGIASLSGDALMLSYGSLDGPAQTYLFSQGDWSAP